MTIIRKLNASRTFHKIRKALLPRKYVNHGGKISTVNGMTITEINGRTFNTHWAIIDYGTFKTVKDGFRNRDEACDYGYAYCATPWFLIPYETEVK